MRSCPSRAVAWLAVAALVLAPAAVSQADEIDPLGGFDDEEAEEFDVEVEFDTSVTEEVDRWWNVDGSVALSTSINWNDHRSATGSDYGDLQRLRLRLNLEIDAALPWDWKFRASPHAWYDFAYLIQGFSNYTPNVRNDYEWEIDFQDTYLEGPLLEDVDLKIGRQVVNWGRSESLRVLDVLNPLDNREPARADIEDLVRSVGMAKLDWYVDRNWTATAIAIPEIRFSDLPSFGSDFNPNGIAPIPEQSPDDLEHWEAAASVRGIFEGWDVSFHYAYLYEDTPSVRVVGLTPMFEPIPKAVHPRIHLGGVGGNTTWGAWLVKSEMAVIEGLEYAGESGDRTRFDAMVGIEYYGLVNHTFSLEIVERHLFGHTQAIEEAPNFVREDSVDYALRWTADWFRERLTTTVLAILLGYRVQDGAIIRAQAEYEVASGVSLTGGILMYQAGDMIPLTAWGLNDRVFLDFKYSF